MSIWFFLRCLSRCLNLVLTFCLCSRCALGWYHRTPDLPTPTFTYGLQQALMFTRASPVLTLTVTWVLILLEPTFVTNPNTPLLNYVLLNGSFLISQHRMGPVYWQGACLEPTGHSVHVNKGGSVGSGRSQRPGGKCRPIFSTKESSDRALNSRMISCWPKSLLSWEAHEYP